MNTWAETEMLAADIKDGRRRKSMASVLNSLAERPNASFSSAAGPAGRQAAHRLFSDETVAVCDLLAGHFEQTAARIKAECGVGMVLIVQDTTDFNFTNLKTATGLGYINNTDARGIFGHSAYALTCDGLPLGLLHLKLWIRDYAARGKSRVDRRKLATEEKESYRWIETVQSSEEQLPLGLHALFIQDREADIFAFLEMTRRSTTHLLVRANQERNVELVGAVDNESPRQQCLFDIARSAPVVGRMPVSIPRAPGRPARDSELIVQSACVRIQPPKDRKGVGNDPVTAWIVRACEINPPEGQKAVEWVLITTMPIPDGAAACQLVGFYSIRWGIERLHYTVKSGCRAEALQMDDVHSIKMALALYFVVAWRLLHLTYLARTHADAPASIALRQSEIAVLEQLEKKPIPTIAVAVIAIAKLGGHEPYKNGPPPGVKALWLGHQRLEGMEAGWLLALESLQPLSQKDMIHD